jgi:lysozyme
MVYRSNQSRGKNQLQKLLILEEGYKEKPYRCTQGYLTIGVGHNLDASGLCEAAIIAQLEHDIEVAKQGAMRIAPGWFEKLDRVRQEVLILMVFQLGERGASKFVNTLADIKAGNYKSAADRIRRSTWAGQTPMRVARLCNLLESGKYERKNKK